MPSWYSTISPSTAEAATVSGEARYSIATTRPSWSLGAAGVMIRRPNRRHVGGEWRLSSWRRERAAELDAAMVAISPAELTPRGLHRRAENSQSPLRIGRDDPSVGQEAHGVDAARRGGEHELRAVVVRDEQRAIGRAADEGPPGGREGHRTHRRAVRDRPQPRASGEPVDLHDAVAGDRHAISGAGDGGRRRGGVASDPRRARQLGQQLGLVSFLAEHQRLARTS